ncbi:exopolyphosphatase [Halalkalibacter kiskunsagensis]|uniref:Exopolyphosphatase n=1 Tax=Halalkalibacter kiskunsagensis TaxID=1548599 RepID=A0ABV6KJI7_9BACI
MVENQVAIIDMGSNSIRLVINKIDFKGCYNEIHNYKTVARLSSHITKKGNLSDDGIAIILETLNRFKDVILFHNVKKLTVVATAAMRKAKNQNQIVQLVKDKIDFDIRVLSEYEEAFYGYLAVVNSTNVENGYTVDIGGGSTEVTLFENRELKHYHSFPFGAITLQEQFFGDKQPTSTTLKALKSYINEQLHTLPWLKSNLEYPVIGIGGSARNLSLIHQRQTEYPLPAIHQYEISRNEMIKLNDMLQQSTFEERLLLDGLSKERADIIIPAAEVISSLVSHVNGDAFMMSRKGLRDGVFYEELLKKMETTHFPNVVEESFHRLSHNYEVNIEHVNHVSSLAIQLYNELSSFCPVDHTSENAWTLLNQSARVLYIGEYINNDASSQNTFYLLTNMTIEGLSHRDQLAVAFISSFKSKAQLLKYAEPFLQMVQKKDLKFYEFLGSIMKLAYSLDRTRRKAIHKVGPIEKTEDELTLSFYYQEETFFENMQATKNKKHIERAVKHPIHFRYIPIEVLKSKS